MVQEMVDCHDRVKLESPQNVLNAANWVLMANNEGGVKAERCWFLPPEAEACSWLRDELDNFDRKDCGSINTCWSASLPGSLKPLRDPREDTRGGANVLSSKSRLYAQLRATKVRESVIKDAIQRLGGGQKGLRAVVKVILFWLQQKNCCLSESNDANLDLAEVIDELKCCNVAPGSVVDAPFSWYTNFDCCAQENITSPAYEDVGRVFCDSNFSCNVGEVRDYVDQSHVLIGEPGKRGGVLDRSSMQVSQESCAVLIDPSPTPSGSWVPFGLTPECPRSDNINKLSPTLDLNAIFNSPEITAYDDATTHRSKMRRSSPPCGSDLLPQGSGELPACSTPADVSSNEAIFGSVGENPFGQGCPFGSSTSPPLVDPHSLDASLGLQGGMFIDEHVTMGGSGHGCNILDRFGPLATMYPVSRGNSLEQEHSIQPPLETIAKARASPASIRLARKNRVDRNRKMALNHVSRAAAVQSRTGAGSNPRATWPVSRNMVQPHAFTSPDGQRKDRSDDHLQVVLQKMLSPSDVGSLGRIVLPKKDVESHLPWLGAREGVQFVCEDYDTGETLVLRYRFWPNNKSRMYLLENTGDFVKKHQLKESDGLILYKDQQRGTFIIRGRKARDCLDSVSSQHQVDKGEGGGSGSENGSGATPTKENVEPSDTVGASPVETPSVETPSEPILSTINAVLTQQDDLLNFADLPDAPMGVGSENLVRFPSLEAFDVEMLDLVEEAARSSRSATG